MFDTTLFGTAFITLFVIMDPPGAVPVFLALTSGRSKRDRRHLALQAAAVSLVVISCFAVFGQQILNYLGISVPALEGSGGLLLLLVALELLTGRADQPSETTDVNVALVPLGTPLLAGPGAIVAVILFVQRIHDAADFLAVAAAIVLVHVAIWLTLRFSVNILRVIKDSGVTLVTRIAGLLLAAIAVQMVATASIAFAKLA
ncbi:MAG TPA: MarC family protein [Actinocrinis sp.]|uniref:MarC family protein n=1 Tax=Actinocrinis sp. TaxID=1920516 RepID=UPI002DDD2978|nr:MarC family protein [Actinocrinis sp.]HEV2342813.1 MarC family protein [Actinocrinis sp.]